MKKRLLLGSALLVAIIAFPQQKNITSLKTGTENAAQKINESISSRNNVIERTKPSNYQATQATATEEETSTTGLKTSNTSTLVTTWKTISGSMNIYGVLVENSKPLQYNEDLNAVSFVHRKSAYYQPLPVPTTTTAESGVLVGMVSQNWGATWDSTCIWNNDTYWARYPQGGIYNPMSPTTNTLIDNAYIVAMGPVTQAQTALGWVGNAFASKQLNAANNTNTPSSVLNAQQYLPSLAPALGLGKTDFARLDFQSLDNGNIVALGNVSQDANGTTAATQLYRGARVIKGSFNSGVFVWSGDSVIPAVTSSLGDKNLISAANMAWSEDGSVGYVVHIGCSPSTSLSNTGFQPIVWKSVNGGAWAKVGSIDFNSPAMSVVMNKVFSTRVNSLVAIPFFDFTMGIGTTVDKDNKLHIATTIRSAVSAHPDSLGFTYLFDNADAESYSYAHSPGARPYLFDFIGDGTTPWNAKLIDSLSSEGPSALPTGRGFSTNPWDATGGTANNEKVSCEARIQLSRTADGKYVVYTWAESDTAVTTNGLKWNEFPNVKARMMDVTAQTINTLEINVTNPGTTYTNIVSPVGPGSVRGRAFFHYTSPKCALASTLITSNGPALYVPMTVTRNEGLQQEQPVVHKYISALLNFSGVALPTISVSISENSILSVNNSYIYPNPANNQATLSIDLKNNSTVELKLINMVGQVVTSSKTYAFTGANTINLDINGLAKGIYMVSVKVDGASSTKKLIVD